MYDSSEEPQGAEFASPLSRDLDSKFCISNSEGSHTF
jgi:hypothetical protein